MGVGGTGEACWVARIVAGGRRLSCQAMRLILLLAAWSALVLAGCGASPSASTGNGAGPGQEQQGALTQLNAYRLQAGVAPIGLSQALDIAATRHAGYQILKNAASSTTSIILTHYETVDGTPTGTPDTSASNVFFTAVTPAQRYELENGGQDLYPSSLVLYSEGLTTGLGTGTIVALWNSVYHRLPLVRSTTTLFGFGDSEQVFVQYPTIPVNEFAGFGTTATAGSSGFPVLRSVWPPDGTRYVQPTFDPQAETPDPIGTPPTSSSTINTSQSPPCATTPITAVGPPLEVTLPTSLNWMTVVVSFTAHNSTTQLPVYVLAGFVNTGTATAPVFPPSLPSGVTCYDANLNPGELVIVPQQPLALGSSYDWSVTATTVASGGGSDQITTGPTPLTFTTAQ